MPDIKTALATALKDWTKDDKEPDVHPAPAAQPHDGRHWSITNNVSRELFDHVKTNPGTERARVADALCARGFKKSSVQSLIGQYITAGMFEIRNGGLFAHTGEYKPVSNRMLREAREARKEEFRFPKRKKEVRVEPLPAPESLRIGPVPAPLPSPQEIVDRLSLTQARDLYKLLKAYFSE
jgi:hypothetical protein